jgi:hypothetical protein
MMPGKETFMRRASVALLALLLAASAGACSRGGKAAPESAATSGTAAPASPAPTQTPTQASPLPSGGVPVHLDPARFTARIDNPWWPMKPGNRWVYRETDAQGNEQRIDVTVTGRTKKILGIEARVVHDVASSNGQVVEDTYDWYAQDDQGNVWYMGEDTKEYQNGRVASTEGSWEGGVDGAQPGVVVPAHPRPGMAYRQEYYKSQAEDAAQVLSLGRKAKVPYGAFANLLITKEFTPLEPGVVEHKFYAPGVGQVLAVTVSGGSSREELVQFQHTP